MCRKGHRRQTKYHTGGWIYTGLQSPGYVYAVFLLLRLPWFLILGTTTHLLG